MVACCSLIVFNPTPTLPVEGLTVSGELCTWRLGENAMSSTAMVTVINPLRVLVLWLAKMFSTA